MTASELKTAFTCKEARVPGEGTEAKAESGAEARGRGRARYVNRDSGQKGVGGEEQEEKGNKAGREGRKRQMTLRRQKITQKKNTRQR